MISWYFVHCSQCNCGADDKDQIYAPTTTHADNCPRCGRAESSKGEE